MGWGGSCRGRVGWGGSCRGAGVCNAGVGWVMQGCGGVEHVGWGGSCRGGWGGLFM